MGGVSVTFCGAPDRTAETTGIGSDSEGGPDYAVPFPVCDCI